MASITITIVDLPHGHVSVRTDADRPIVGVGITLAQGLAMELLGTAFKRGAEVIYDPAEVPLVALALDLLHVEQFGLAVTQEIRDRAKRALGREVLIRSAMDGVNIDRVHIGRGAPTINVVTAIDPADASAIKKHLASRDDAYRPPYVSAGQERQS
ncbi:hypothetical protein [Variovorax sp. UMC13]|uniref:hypothetical protein n=1 Tax=Variovorax sp. UMC13 TaxID=1862326 RepID=UPI0016034C5C|nr:hypothetical protein [Variovorax sp. UMC13]MBB1601255.1 hypothetical protein [Variovorax sp. UMC13]